jgi:MoaA/NifB/PqqE/SkfB family radical SAM enzyme
MQNPNLELKEIIWEITSECHNGCSYCGSKSQCHQETNPYTIKKIVDEIAKYQPKEINISGGDPLIVPLEIHKYIKEQLNETKIKILINPKSIKYTSVYDNKIDIMELYDAIGVSVNTQEELNIISEIYHIMSCHFKKPPTLITNFNLSNVFMFDKINQFCMNNDNIWQIQFTVYPKNNDQLALYNNENELACEFLFEKINDALNNNAKIVVADNMNDGNCSAGINSLGILSDGSIVPCLSMRSWTDVNANIQGNILEQQTSFNEAPNLSVIWQDKFRTKRFCKFACCKDHCSNKVFNRRKSVGQDFIEAIKKLKPIEDNPIICPPLDEFPKKPEPYNPNIVMVYGIVDRWGGGFKKINIPDSTEIYSVRDTWTASDGETTA